MELGDRLMADVTRFDLAELLRTYLCGPKSPLQSRNGIVHAFHRGSKTFQFGASLPRGHDGLFFPGRAEQARLRKPAGYTLVGLVEQSVSGLIQFIDLALPEVSPVLFPRQPALNGHVRAGIALEDSHNFLLAKPPHICSQDVL